MSDTDAPRSFDLGGDEEEAPLENPHEVDISRTREVRAELADVPPTTRGSWAWRLIGSGVALVAVGLLTAAAEGLVLRAWAEGSVFAWVGLAGMVLLSLGIGTFFFFEWWGLGSIEGLGRARNRAVSAAGGDRAAAGAVLDGLRRMYGGRRELAEGWRRLEQRQGDAADAEALFALTELEILAPLDEAARRVAVRTARRTAMITAISPFAVLDMSVTFVLNMRLLRQIAVTYGGRPGWLGSWRLLRLSVAQILASGALEVADDTVGHLLGVGIASKLSRRAGIGILNGLLTARIAVAAMGLCRPLPWGNLRPPTARALFAQAFTEHFGGAAAGPASPDPNRPDKGKQIVSVPSDPAPPPPRDEGPDAVRDAFRRSMQAMASTVAVVTAEVDGRRGGLTATAVCSLSMEPPMILVCVYNAAQSHGLIAEGGKFCVNLLAEEQTAVATAFAGVGPDAAAKFRAGTWQTRAGRPPELAGALARIDCDLVRRVDAATHTIFIGEVRRAETDPDRQPLLYADRFYRRLAPTAPPG